jgi:hypothetical protein
MSSRKIEIQVKFPKDVVAKVMEKNGKPGLCIEGDPEEVVKYLMDFLNIATVFCPGSHK